VSDAPLDLAALARQADAAGDAQLARFAQREPQGAVERVSDLLDELLRWKPGVGSPPAELTLDLAKPLALPDWAERHGGLERLGRAQRLFAERQTPAFVVLGFASLPACYRQPEIAELLASSGRLSVQVFRRLRETADFVDAVTQPGAFEPDGLGFAWCCKVRLVHAAMRFLARHQPPESTSPTGRELQDFLLRRSFTPGDPEPIDQNELAFVLQTFGYLTVRGLRALRIRLATDEAADFLFLWSVVGHLLGIRDELLPRPAEGAHAEALEERARYLYDTIDAWNHARAGISDSGRLLTATLIVTMREAMLRAAPSLAVLQRCVGRAHPLRWLPRRVVDSIDRALRIVVSSAPRSFVRLLLGRRAAEELGVDRAPLLHYLGHQVAFLVAGRVASRSAKPVRVPRHWARTPAEFCRQDAVLLLGRRLNRWRRLRPPPFADTFHTNSSRPRA
jgi:hypothetical protein